MTKINERNSELYYLGKICKRNHLFAETANSLRQISNRTCVECQKNANQKHKTVNPQLCTERTKRWRRKIAENTIKKSPTKKRCCVCGEQKTANNFYPAKYSADGLIGHCLLCDKARQNTYREKNRKPIVKKNPELIKENRRRIKNKYKRTIKGKLANTKYRHRRKAKMLEIEAKTYTPTELLLKFSEFGKKCAYCGDSKKITIDHFFPISKFGADSIENIVSACIRCNSSKNNKDPEVWFKAQSFYSIEKWLILISKTHFQKKFKDFRRVKFGLGLHLYDQNK